jgi:hypothetical protein
MELSNLPERPRAEALTVEEILHEATAGRLRLPDFQRGLQWKTEHVLELFDSLLRGFPVGNLLLWEREAEAAPLSFGPVRVEAPAQRAARYIVDGQQRITALVGALLNPQEEPTQGIYAVWLDLEELRFLSWRNKTAACVPLNLFGARPRLLQWARKQDDEALVERAFEVEARLLKYGIPAYVVRDVQEETLRTIFGRVNSAGVPLGEAQVFQALFGSPTQARPLDALIETIKRETGFGALSGDWVLRCAKSIGQLPATARFTERQPPTPKLLEATREGLLGAIRFLQEDGGIAHALLLPYRLPLIVLSNFFHHFPDPCPRNRELLARWLWRGTLSGAHGKSDHTTLTRYEQALTVDESVTVQSFLARAPGGEQKLPTPLGHWRGSTAATRLYATAILSLRPLKSSGEDLSPEEIGRALTEKGLSESFRPWAQQKNHQELIAGRVFWPEEGLSSLREAPPEVLDSHGFPQGAPIQPEEAEEALLKERAACLEEALGRLVQRYTRADDHDRPPLRAILAGAVAS